MLDALPTVPWSQCTHLLRSFAAEDLDLGMSPQPTLLAYEGDRALATVMLRPFADGEVVGAVLEVLALLLPLGTDRLVLSLPGRAWSALDPIAPVTADADLRQRVLLICVADGTQVPAALSVRVHGIELGAEGWRWEGTIDAAEEFDSPLVDVLRLLLDARGRLLDTPADIQIAAQFGRVLLRGHEVHLSALAAERLEEHSLAG